jgi:hypothetical protein
MMAVMVGARRALLAARYSPRGAISAAAPVLPYRRVELPHRYLALPRRLVDPMLRVTVSFTNLASGVALGEFMY